MQPPAGHPGFRGSIAPASLKLGHRPPVPACDRGFRGSIAPASLKRVRAGSLVRELAAGFRGSIAPASLKLVGDASHNAARSCFRGSIAPASLKLAVMGDYSKAIASFPGLYCPGLIEAGCSHGSGDSSRAVSGALLPRPH